MRICACLFLMLSMISVAWGGYGETWDLPNAESAADPMVLEADGAYYLYITSSYNDFECWSSSDLNDWTYEGVIWENPGPGNWNDRDLWAPEVHRDGDDYYLYYAANMMIGVARADNPLGPFVDVFDHPFVGDGYNGVNGLAIDAHVFRDDDGRRYFYYAGYEPFSVVRVAAMADMTTLTGTHRTVVKPGIVNWELFVAEAPWIVKHEGLYYLMYSGYGADRPYYAVGYATSESPLGPFDEYLDNPILHYDPDKGIYGPGHNCTVEDPADKLQIVYHTKVGEEIGWDRQIRMNDLCFSADGEMYVGLFGCMADDDAMTDDDTGGQDDDSTSETGEQNDDDDDEQGCGQ